MQSGRRSCHLGIVILVLAGDDQWAVKDPVIIKGLLRMADVGLLSPAHRSGA
jgi:hypothetical protein